ncbi:MAG: lipoxygenase family protein [Candidatus Manganitrophus sp.]|nr:lipoxygenase family protein [Candidatus Manganitrophus sp.]MDC4226641.1 lipoxygenase family protein [Candidatus Manganitrophus sp.]WDT72202.1 MAG: lipoxygenase family protein [Candidatus Manganitrophus sp.]WDT80382.1 MAG: lipoxygenase family protein [Candidatus Manganitrophus sp.]
MSRVAATTEKIKPTTQYTYDYARLPPLAMSGALPDIEAFSARPDWIHLVARSALKILINTIMIGIKNTGDNIEFVQQVLKNIQAVARQLEGEAGRDLNNAIAMELEKQGSPTTPAQLKALLEVVIEPIAPTLNLKTLYEIGGIVQQLGSVSGPASSLEDYSQVFQFISLPAISRNFREDSEFAAMRVAGPNPLTIQRMKTLDERLPITNEQYQAVIGTQDTLMTALADGRLYLADYSAFEGAVNGSFPAGQKFNYAPLALFAVPPGGRSLVPVAIQCGPKPGTDHPIFLPHDGDHWFMAKSIVQVADTNIHQAVSHLGQTHLFIEPFVIATHNQLSRTHPLFLLLTPHFKGTLAINEGALGLLAPRGLVDLLLASSIDQSRVFAVKAAQSYQQNLNTSMLPQTLAQRGVDDASRLPDYPYRDDALLLWGAIHQWVENYVNYYYTSDAAVQADTELQNWVTELVSRDGGRLNNIGSANRISKRTELVDLITLICFTASAQHAAVNFPQAPLMSYLPATPPAGYSPLSSLTREGFRENDFLKFLPPLDIAKALLDILYLLSSVYYTRLGDYGDNYFTDPAIQNYLAKFQQELVKIEEEINQRNKMRTPYEFLLPSKIPQSINI